MRRLSAILTYREHREFIQRQERIAEAYRPVSGVTTEGGISLKKQVMTPWGLVDADLIENLQPIIQPNEPYFKDKYVKG